MKSRRIPGPMWRSARLQRHEEELAAVEALGEILGGQPVVPVKDESGRQTGEHVRASLMERVTACAALLCGGYPEIGDDVAKLLEAAPHDPKAVAQGLLTLYGRVHG